MKKKSYHNSLSHLMFLLISSHIWLMFLLFCVCPKLYILFQTEMIFFYQVGDCPLAAPSCVLSFLSSKNAYSEPERVIMHQAPSQSLSREMRSCDWSSAGQSSTTRPITSQAVEAGSPGL